MTAPTLKPPAKVEVPMSSISKDGRTFISVCRTTISAGFLYPAMALAPRESLIEIDNAAEDRSANPCCAPRSTFVPLAPNEQVSDRLRYHG